MNDSKTYRSIASLDIYERNNFKKFLQSPYFNKNQKLLDLYELFDEHLRGKLDKLEKEEVWKTIFDSPFQDSKLRKLNNDLLKQFERFITIEHIEKDEKAVLTYQLKAINDRNLELLYNSVKAKLDRINKITIDRSADHYFFQYDTEKTKFELKSDIERKSKRSDFSKEFNVAEISRNLDIFYLSEKLKYICTTLSWSKIYKIEIEPFDISSFEKFIFERKEIIPPIAIYYQIYLTLTDPDNLKHFTLLRKLITNYIDLFPLKEQRYIYDSAVSYGVGKVNAGNLDLQRPTFELYKQALKSDGFYENGYLSESSFRNIIFFALRNEEFEWAEEFISKYSNDLKPEIKDNAVSFNLARIKFYQKKFGEVISLIQNVNYVDSGYDLNSRSFLLASYYELEELDSLESLINSTNSYVRREKRISETRKRLILNQNKFLKKLISTNPMDKKALHKLKETLQNTSGVASKPWLLEKIDELL